MGFRVPPQNLEAEQSVLGGLLLKQEAWDEISDIISSKDFYKTGNQKIFSAIQELTRKNEVVDLITLSNLLSEKNELEAVGGASYLAQVINDTPSPAHIFSYAKIVAEKAILRKLINSCTEITGQAYDQDFENLENFLDEAEAKVFSVAEKQKSTGLVDSGEIVRHSLEKIEDLYNRKAEITGVPSGFKELDKLTAGFQAGELIIVAARPSMGKTAFCCNIAVHAAVREKKSVAFFSVEMSKEGLMMRMLAAEARINMSDVRVGKISDSLWPKLINSAAILSEAELYIDETSGISPYEIRAKCRRLKAQQGLDLVIIDYLQLMDLKQKVESRERAVSEISKTLKALAKELNLPVIALAQLNRGVEGRADRRPLLSDLRESGSIEQDADVICMLYREEYYDRENPDNRGVAEVIVGKQRNGPVGTVKLSWIPKYGSFVELAMEPSHPLPPPPPPPSFSSGKRPRNFAPGNP